MNKTNNRLFDEQSCVCPSLIMMTSHNDSYHMISIMNITERFSNSKTHSVLPVRNAWLEMDIASSFFPKAWV